MNRHISLLTLVIATSLAGSVLLGQPDTAYAGDDDPEIAKTITLKPVGNQMKYDKTEIEATAGTKIKVIFENTATSSAMQHNFALLKADADINDVGVAAIKAGSDQGYIPDDGLIANTDIAEPGETKSVVFTVPPPGEYDYICLYPGHYTQMQGTLTSKE